MVPGIARTIFRIQERFLGRTSFAILKQLRASEYWSREQLDQLRLEIGTQQNQPQAVLQLRVR